MQICYLAPCLQCPKHADLLVVPQKHQEPPAGGLWRGSSHFLQCAFLKFLHGQLLLCHHVQLNIPTRLCCSWIERPQSRQVVPSSFLCEAGSASLQDLEDAEFPQVDKILTNFHLQCQEILQSLQTITIQQHRQTQQPVRSEQQCFSYRCALPLLPLLLRRLSRVRLCATPETAAHQAPLSLGFSRQEHWSGSPFPASQDLPDPGIKPVSLASVGGFFTTVPPKR